MKSKARVMCCYDCFASARFGRATSGGDDKPGEVKLGCARLAGLTGLAALCLRLGTPAGAGCGGGGARMRARGGGVAGAAPARAECRKSTGRDKI